MENQEKPNVPIKDKVSMGYDNEDKNYGLTGPHELVVKIITRLKEAGIEYSTSDFAHEGTMIVRLKPTTIEHEGKQVSNIDLGRQIMDEVIKEATGE